MRHKTAHNPTDRCFGCRGNRCKARPRFKLPLYLIVILVLSVMLMCLSGAAAAAGNVSIEAGSHWIKGSARQAPLGEVLGRLSDETGCEIYIDEKLYDTPVTFDMPDPVPSEQAIRRMIHPYNNAMVYEAVPGTGQIRIQQIKVFDEGGQATRYVHAVGQGVQSVSPSHPRGSGETRLSTLLSNKGVSAGEEGVRKHVQPPLTVEKSAMGIPNTQYRRRGKLPDYRPNALTMSKAYAKYRQERTVYDQRSSQAQMLNGHRNAMQAQARYRAQRAQSLKNALESNR